MTLLQVTPYTVPLVLASLVLALLAIHVLYRFALRVSPVPGAVRAVLTSPAQCHVVDGILAWHPLISSCTGLSMSRCWIVPCTPPCS